ncbi:unnamed protein product [Blumeria hordei]|uniref:Uncharacterized protein n=2 Tax=Blumeria hordei TaxID=2867405 RepID=A0A383UUB8_BLUHO|nr:hypothetical protein BGHDH14_bgh06809 [Blumeria hordei DH14]SZF02852.1 unnamed protein product [Blumeria hordei]
MLPSGPQFVMKTHCHSPSHSPDSCEEAFKVHRENSTLFPEPTFPEHLTSTTNISIKPYGDGSGFSYTPLTAREHSIDLSPYTSSPGSSPSRPSSPTSSTSDDKDRASISPPRCLRPLPAYISLTRSHSTIKQIILSEGTFTIEEFESEDYEAWDPVSNVAIRPYQYEDADSELANVAFHDLEHDKTSDLDARIAGEFQNLTTENASDDHEAWVEASRAERRRRRRSSVQKRTLSMSIGSDTDDEDLQPIILEANEAGSSARRLRRRVCKRVSLIFDDPPERIDEEDEGPEVAEEAVEIDGDDELQRELPYWGWSQIMDIESDSDS